MKNGSPSRKILGTLPKPTNKKLLSNLMDFERSFVCCIIKA